MLLDGKLQLMDGGYPVRPFFKERTGTEFADAIFKTARGHAMLHGTNRQ